MTSILNVCGTFNQVLPNAIATAISVEPIPVANAPKAPDVQVCESAPTNISLGLTKVSTNLWWQTPAPTSDNTAPYSLEKFLKTVWVFDNSLRGLGDAWSMKRIVLSGLNNFSFPNFLNSWTVKGPVPSWTAVTSTFAITNSPALTFFPACFDIIFSANVCPITSLLFYLF